MSKRDNTRDEYIFRNTPHFNQLVLQQDIIRIEIFTIKIDNLAGF